MLPGLVMGHSSYFLGFSSLGAFLLHSGAAEGGQGKSPGVRAHECCLSESGDGKVFSCPQRLPNSSAWGPRSKIITDLKTTLISWYKDALLDVILVFCSIRLVAATQVNCFLILKMPGSHLLMTE